MLGVEKFGIECAALPLNTTGAAVAGQYVSLKRFNHLTILIQMGAWAGGTPAVTLSQATAVAGTGAKSAPIPAYWSKLGTTAGLWVRTPVVSDTFNLPNVANTLIALELDAEQLDVSNGFDAVSLQIASPGANADLIAAMYVLSEPRFNGAIMLDAKVD